MINTVPLELKISRNVYQYRLIRISVGRKPGELILNLKPHMPGRSLLFLIY